MLKKGSKGQRMARRGRVIIKLIIRASHSNMFRNQSRHYSYKLIMWEDCRSRLIMMSSTATAAAGRD